jgi:hypothetical protein
MKHSYYTNEKAILEVIEGAKTLQERYELAIYFKRILEQENKLNKCKD